MSKKWTGSELAMVRMLMWIGVLVQGCLVQGLSTKYLEMADGVFI